ncbi:MAG: methyltransferase domain-containing protein [Candidatus Omnitrophica bacterium]|nr:methyltransferase domain-containing protein [Candidatus Omnitrophota bacterium]
MKYRAYELSYAYEERYWWYVARRNILLSQLECLLHKRAADTKGKLRILDYGCGTGLNMKYLSKFGETYGVDTSQVALDFCRMRGLGDYVKIYDPDNSGMSNPFDEPFDVITVLDVLEHISDDRRALQHIHELLKPEGILLVMVPAYKFLRSGEDFVSEHKRRYTSELLGGKIRDTAFNVIKLSYFNCILFPLQFTVVIGRRIFRPSSMYRTILSPLPQFLNSILKSIMSFEVNILHKYNLPIGGSILCCARKNTPNVLTYQERIEALPKMKALKEIGTRKAYRYVLYEIVLFLFKFMLVSPLRVWFLRMLGVKMGRDVIMHDVSFFNCYRKGFRGLKIGDNCFIGNQCLFDLADEIELGNNVTIANRVSIITHLNVGYKDHPLHKFFPSTSKKVVIKDNSFIGINSTILSGVTIGEGSFVSATSLVNKDVPENTFVAGIPAKPIRSIS